MPENLDVDESNAKPAGTTQVDSPVLVSNRQPCRHRYDSEDGHEVVVDTTAEAIEGAVATTERERRERMRALRWTVHETDRSWWLDETLKAAAEARQENRHHGHA